MNGMNNFFFKIVNAHQARIVCKYKNTNEKLFKTNATTWFNNQYEPTV